MRAFFNQLSQAFMLPIALLPAAGLMLGIGASFSNQETAESYGWTFLYEGTFMNSFLQVMEAAGDIVFANLPLMFAIAVAVGFAKNEKGAAALAAVMSYLIMNVTIATTMNLMGVVNPETGVITFFGRELNGMLTTVLGIENTLSMGVFGGMIAGGITAFLHNKYYDIKLPEYLGFFGGPRFVPIIASFAALIYGMALVFIWPPIGVVFNSIGMGLGVLTEANLGWIASLVFGIIERALIPFGLHHVFYLPLWQSEVGGTAVIAGETVAGTQNIFFASLAANDFSQFTSTNFMSGKFPFMMFGLPAAAYAMYTVADDENKKQTGGIMFSVALTSFLTGITEPIEFTFLFVAPMLYYGIHVPLAGISFMLMDILNVKVGMTFSGGFIDFLLYGVLPGTVGGVDNNWYWIIIIGLLYIPIYFFTFRWYILKFNVPTPGRGGAKVEVKRRADYNERNNSEKENADENAEVTEEDEVVEMIVEHLGGYDNLSNVTSCITRLRITVKDASIVEKENSIWTQELGASGIVTSGESIQIIYGAKAAAYDRKINAKLAG